MVRNNHKINQLKVGAIISYLSLGLGYCISLIYTPIMLRLLGQSEFGLYNLVLSVVSYLGLLSFGFSSAYMRYYLRYKVKSDNSSIAKLNGMFLIVYSVLGLVALLFGTLMVIYSNNILGSKLSIEELKTAKILMSIMIINLAITFPSSIFNSHITANERFVFLKILQLIKVIVNPFLILPILFMGFGSIGLVVVTTSINVSIHIIYVIYCFKKLQIKFSFTQFDFKLMKELTVFSSFIFINILVDQINWSVDKFIIGRYIGTVSVAIYGLAALINTYYLTLSSTISSLFIPRVHQLVALKDDNTELTNLFTRVGRLQFILLSLIFSGFVFFGRVFIRMWAGTDYSDSYIVVLILISVVTIPLIQNLGIEIQRAKNMHKFRSIVYFFIALINIGITIPLVKEYGVKGAAVGTAISLFMGNIVIMNLYYHLKVNLNMIFFWREIFKILPAYIIPIIFGYYVVINIDLYNILNFIIFGFLYSLIYVISLWFIGMNNYEKRIVSVPYNELIKKLTNKH